MNSRDFRNLTEAYNSIYIQEEETFFFKEDIDLLSDSDIDEAVEEAIDELLDEGFTLEEIDQAFDDFDDSFIAEAKKRPTGRLGNMKFPGDDDIKYGETRSNANEKAKEAAAKLKSRNSNEDAARSAREAASKAPKTSSTGSSNVVKRSGGSMNSRYLKGSSGSSSSNTKTSAKSNTKTSAKVTTSGTPVRAKMTSGDDRASDRKPNPSSSSSSSSPAGKVSGSVKKTIAHKTTDADHADAVRRSRAASLEKALDSPTTSPTIRSRVGSSIKKAASSAKKGLKGMIKKAADKVASGANKVSKRMSEEYDQFDLVLEFLQTEGFAESLDEARVLMVNELDREDIETIVNAYN